MQNRTEATPVELGKPAGDGPPTEPTPAPVGAPGAAAEPPTRPAATPVPPSAEAIRPGAAAPAGELPGGPAPADASGDQRPGFRLHRSRTQRMIGGVCGGLAESLGADPVLLRLALVVLTLLGFGTGALLYLAAWLLVPEGD